MSTPGLQPSSATSEAADDIRDAAHLPHAPHRHPRGHRPGRQGHRGAAPVLIVLLVTILIVVLTKFTSNTATAAAFLPVMGGVAVGIGSDTLLLVIPVALASTYGFMMPAGTPPNAIAYSSGYVRIGDMIKGGILLNLIGAVLITLFTAFVGPWVLGYTLR